MHDPLIQGYYFTDRMDPNCLYCGLLIVYASGGSIGHWEVSSGSSGFNPLTTDHSSLSLIQPCLEKQSMTFRGTVSPENCAGNCTGSDTVSASVCPAHGYVRFLRDDGISGWTAVEALAVKIVFLAFDQGGQMNGTEGTISLPAPNCLQTVSRSKWFI